MHFLLNKLQSDEEAKIVAREEMKKMEAQLRTLTERNNELSQKYNLANYQTIADKLFYIQQNKHNHSLDNIFKTYNYITEILEIAHTYNNTLNQINKIIYKYHFKF